MKLLELARSGEWLSVLWWRERSNCFSHISPRSGPWILPMPKRLPLSRPRDIECRAQDGLAEEFQLRKLTLQWCGQHERVEEKTCGCW